MRTGGGDQGSGHAQQHQHPDGGPGEHAKRSSAPTRPVGRPLSPTLTSTAIATNSSASETSMCGATVHQASPVRTVMPPQTACSNTPTRQHGGQPGQRRTSGRGQQQGQEDAERRDEDDPGQGSVGELDGLVERGHPGTRDRDQRTGLTLRPGRAAEPRSGDPDGGAGHGDATVGDHREPGQHLAGPAAWSSAATRAVVRARSGLRSPSNSWSLPSEPPYGADPADDHPSGQHAPGSPALGAAPLCSTLRGAPLDRAPAGVSPPTTAEPVRRRVSGTTTPPTSTIANQSRLAKASTASARRVPPSNRASPMKAAAPSNTSSSSHAGSPCGCQPRNSATVPRITHWQRMTTSARAALARDQQAASHAGGGQSFQHAVAPVEGSGDGLRGEGCRHDRQGEHAGCHRVDPGRRRGRRCSSWSVRSARPTG